MFHKMADKINERFIKMQNENETLYIVDVTRDELFAYYISLFTPEQNPIFQERTEHDCNMCNNFIRNAGNVVSIVSNQMQSIWDIELSDPVYGNICKQMNEYVLSKSIVNIFFHSEPQVGKQSTPAILANGQAHIFTHFYAPVIAKFYNKDIQNSQHPLRTNAEMLKRAMEELSLNAVATVIDLINQNSIYRGPEHLPTLNTFVTAKTAYDATENKELFAWDNVRNFAACRFRNTVIGSLITDLSEGKDLESSVKSFEAKVAPSNYKRPTALITPAMVSNAVAKIKELDIEDSLKRRYARLSDITINNVIFADKDVASKMKDPLTALLMTQTKTSVPSFDKVEEISIDDFIKNVVPSASSIEVMLENSHLSNFVSLIAPEVSGSKNILQWDNNFSWAYNGGVTDSMRKRVSAAGGRIDGVFRFTHSWNEIEPNQSLMDLHVFMPGHKQGTTSNVHDNYGSGNRVGWNNRIDHLSGGTQDVDYTEAALKGYAPIENITFPDLNKMPDGTYTCKIHNWSFRNSGGRGKAEIEFNGQVYQYEYPATKNKEWITIAEVTLKNGQFSIKHMLPESTSSKQFWNVSTNEFHKISAMMFSPNYWDENASGNKHYMFMLQGCKNPDSIRGLYNEFLSPSLNEHRKVFEILGDQIKCPQSDEQLSGLGFSSSQRNSLVCKVSGNVTRMLKIKF